MNTLSPVERLVDALAAHHGTEGQTRYRPGQVRVETATAYHAAFVVARGRDGRRVRVEAWNDSPRTLYVRAVYGWETAQQAEPEEWRGIPWAEAANRIGRMPRQWRYDYGLLDEPWSLPN